MAGDALRVLTAGRNSRDAFIDDASYRPGHQLTPGEGYNRVDVPRSTSTAAKARRRRGPHEEIRLTGDRLIVRNPENGERKTRGGLLIPATAAPAPKRCMWSSVVLVGPDVRAVKTGDRILFLPQAGLEVELNGEEYLLLRERDVQAVASPADGKTPSAGQYL
jgi:chaperonin GroES